MAAAKSKDISIKLRVIVAKNLIEYGYSKQDLAVKLSMSTASLYNKLSNPDKFTLKEIRKLFEVFRFTEAEKLNIL